MSLISNSQNACFILSNLRFLMCRLKCFYIYANSLNQKVSLPLQISSWTYSLKHPTGEQERRWEHKNISQDVREEGQEATSSLEDGVKFKKRGNDIMYDSSSLCLITPVTCTCKKLWACMSQTSVLVSPCHLESTAARTSHLFSTHTLTLTPLTGSAAKTSHTFCQRWSSFGMLVMMSSGIFSTVNH